MAKVNICGTSSIYFGKLYKYLNMTSALFMIEVVRPKSTTFFENQYFSSKIDVFYDFIVVFSYCDFGPHEFSHEKGRSHVYIFIKWAKVNT